jgi:hypothetical protein
MPPLVLRSVTEMMGIGRKAYDKKDGKRESRKGTTVRQAEDLSYLSSARASDM